MDLALGVTQRSGQRHRRLSSRAAMQLIPTLYGAEASCALLLDNVLADWDHAPTRLSRRCLFLLPVTVEWVRRLLQDPRQSALPTRNCLTATQWGPPL
jgi:hypothetical protein